MAHEQAHPESGPINTVNICFNECGHVRRKMQLLTPYKPGDVILLTEYDPVVAITVTRTKYDRGVECLFVYGTSQKPAQTPTEERTTMTLTVGSKKVYKLSKELPVPIFNSLEELIRNGCVEEIWIKPEQITIFKPEDMNSRIVGRLIDLLELGPDDNTRILKLTIILSDLEMNLIIKHF